MRGRSEDVSGDGRGESRRAGRTRREGSRSDAHGNAPALAAVLADVDRAGVDAVGLNGDLADGPMPVPVRPAPTLAAGR